MPNYTLGQLKSEYAHKWAHMAVNEDRVPIVKSQANKIVNNKDKYVSLEMLTGIPWYFIGLVHLRESNCDFDTHLHNGDPLADEAGHYLRTVHVPANRPRNPPINGRNYTFEESALDALEDYKHVKEWSIEQIAYCFEKFNGFGYRMRNVSSPYLWASSNQYVKGKFVKDGAKGWNPNVVDSQLGAMVVLKYILESSDTIIVTPKPIDPLVVTEEKPNTPTANIEKPSTKEMRVTSRKFNLLDWMRWFFGITTGGTAAVKTLDASNIVATKTFIDSTKTFITDYGLVIFLVGTVAAFIITHIVMEYMKQDVVDNRYTPSGEKE